ncbi:hypothetical protein GCM10028808_43590 [Spirosoma migulaei]
MRPIAIPILICLCSCLGLVTCVDPIESTINSSLNVIIVDGTITDVAEQQVIRLSRSQADRLTGRLGSVPITKATVAVVVDSLTVISCPETDDGSYQLPSDFKGQAGHAYQLRFTLSDDTQYESTTEILQPVAPITQARAQFNATSLSSTQRLNQVYAAAHDFYIDFTDPPDQTNYYRWEWKDWERQEWCRSCQGDIYQIADEQGKLIEDCIKDRFTYPHFDYNCRTQCWEILYSNDLTLFDDQYSNGNMVKALRVAQVPLYSKEHCLVEIRQTSLTKQAYTYFKRLNDQTQKTGGVAGAQPALLLGNIYNLAKKNEPVVGYFSASGVSAVRCWLTRSDATGFAPGLFQALNGRDPVLEYGVQPARYRPPLAVCVSSDSRTPYKPEGWRD